MAASFHVASCSFLRLSCRSDHELFSSSYVRSNKKRNSKLLRCFPHCCPDHAPRSYCGCSLHVLVTFESAEDAAAADRNEDLVVCARFESTVNGATSRAGDVVSALQRDDIVALPSSALLPSGDTESDWVRAEKAGDSYQQEFPEEAILYVLNNHRNPQWYYGYDSGSTKTQREMKHVLAVYALVLHPLSGRRSTRGAGTSLPIARLGTVIARHPSPSFTMVSYRRQSNVRRRERDNAQDRSVTQDLDEDTKVGATDDEELLKQSTQPELSDRAGFAMAQALMSMDPERATSHLQVDEECDGAAASQADSRAFTDLGVADDEDENPFASVPPLGLESPCCHFCLGPLVEPPHARHDKLERVRMMQLVLLFMRNTLLGDFSFHFNELDSRIRRTWLSSLSQFEQLHQGEESSARELLAHIRSSFSLARFVPRRSRYAVGHSERERAVLRSCANLLLDAFSSTRVQQILESTSVVQVDIGEQERRVPGLCEHFGQLVADLFDELSKLLAGRRNSRSAVFSRDDDIHYGHTTIPHIVDDILSLVYADPKYRPLRATASALLLRKDDALETSARGLFRAFELQQQACKLQPDPTQRFDRCSSSTPAEPSLAQPSVKQEEAAPNLPIPSNDKWTRRWFLEPASVSITPVSSQIDDSAVSPATDPSLLSVLGLIRIFASIDLALESSQLSVGSSMRGTGQERAVFVLDGQAYPIKTLPNGVVVAAGVALFGDCWGLNEYQGRVSDDRLSMDLLLTIFPLTLQRSRQGSSKSDRAWSAQRMHLHVALEDARDGEESFSVYAQVETVWGTPPPQHSWPPNVQSDLEVNLSWSPTLEVLAVFAGTA